LRVPRTAEVYFVGDEHSGGFLVFFEQFVPQGDVLQGVLLGDIADKHCELCIFEVGGDETAIAFLPCGVPHLQAVVVPVFCDVFDVEVDSYRCLCGKAGTL
jgi:hypothetical protein